MVAMMSYSICFLTFVSSIILRVRCIPDYKFKIQTVYTFQPGVGKPAHSTNPLLRLIPSEQTELCRAAIEYALKHKIPLKKHTNILTEFNEFDIYYKPGSFAFTYIGLNCPCLPKTMLFLPEETENRLIIAVHRNVFLDEKFTFIEETVESVTPAETTPSPIVNRHPTIVTSSTPPENPFEKLGLESRWLLCAAAASKIQQKVGVPLNDGCFEEVGFYNIADRDYSKEIAALKCNTSPVIYIRLATIYVLQRTTFVAVLERSKFDLKIRDVVESSTEEFHSCEHSEPNSEQNNQS